MQEYPRVAARREASDIGGIQVKSEEEPLFRQNSLPDELVVRAA